MNFDPLTKQAVEHTLHCLTGCAIGEVLGMVIGTALKWSDVASIILAIVLAFFFGYLLTIYSLSRKDIRGKKAIKTAIATDTTSITSMEIIDNLIIVLIPGALAAELNNGLFWGSLAVALAIAFVITVPVNRWFISRAGDMHHH